jgi:CRP/FNR family transcriptional regulator
MKEASRTSVPVHDFLTRLGVEPRRWLLRQTTVVQLEKGGSVFNAGSAAKQVYFLASGRIKIYHLTSSGKEILLWLCFPGEVFGLAEVCHVGARQVYAEACEQSEVLCLGHEDFKSFLTRYPEAALLVNEVLASRVRSLGRVIQGLVADDVHERLEQLIVRLAACHGRGTDHGGIMLGIRLTHQELANMIGTTRQSVTTVLNDLRRVGALKFDAHHHIHIHSESLLNQARSFIP